MSEVFTALTLILGLGAIAQWLGWRFKIPAILILIIVGFLAGPATGLLEPDEMFGDLLFPLVSAGVAIILFEGGLTLHLKELKGTASAVLRFVTVGVIVTWVLASGLAYWLLDFPVLFAVLFGAMLTVTGPTVIVPMLRTIRPRGSVKNIAKWEGILNDPIGVILAVLIFEVILAGGIQHAPEHVARGIALTLGIGIIGSGLTAAIIIISIRLKWVPEYLHNIVVLALMLAAFGISNELQEESGLLTVTLLGIIVGNQKYFDIRHITEFKENLQVLLISSLFIVLAARVEPTFFTSIGWESVLFLVLLIAIVRPAAVFTSTVGTRTTFKEGVLLSLLAPRGVVAVALTSIFAIKMQESGTPEMTEQGGRLLAEMLVIVVGTVLFYGLVAPRAAALLKLSNLSPQGVLFIGAHTWARALAIELKKLDIATQLIDANRHHTALAEQEGLKAICGNIFSEEFIKSLDLSDCGHVLALTPNDEVNAIARNTLSGFFERTDIYHLPPHADSRDPYGEFNIVGNPAFTEKATYEDFQQRFEDGARFNHVTIREGFSVSDFEEKYPKATILLLQEEDGRVRMHSVKNPPKPKQGTTIVFLHKPAKRTDASPIAKKSIPEGTPKKKAITKGEATAD